MLPVPAPQSSTPILTFRNYYAYNPGLASTSVPLTPRQNKKKPNAHQFAVCLYCTSEGIPVIIFSISNRANRKPYIISQKHQFHRKTASSECQKNKELLQVC